MGPSRDIYISSTRRDLLAERAIALAQVELMGHRPVSSIPEEMKIAPGPRRVLRECLADLEKCSVYIGIVGWSYGSKPEGREQSYTELEFDRAMQLANEDQMDVYLFLGWDEPRWTACRGFVTPDAKDKERITAFRTKVLRSGRSVMSFEPPGGDAAKTLAALLPARIARHISPASLGKLDGLPHLCDRVPQVERAQELVQNLRRDFSRPLVLLIGGGTEHLPDSFLDSLREQRLARLLCKKAPPHDRFQLQWPAADTPDGFKAALQRSLAAFLESGDGDPVLALGARPGLFVVDTMVGLIRKEDVVRQELLDAFVSFWTSMRLPPREFPVVVIASSARAEKSGLGALFGSQRRVDAQLEGVLRASAARGTDRTAALPLLAPVRRADVDEWRRSPEIVSLCGTGAGSEDIDHLFAEDGERPMRDVAKVLLKYIERRTGARGADP